MKQTAASFGPQQALVGVLTEPDSPRPDAPVILLLNAGLLPRQGPHRMNVRIARALSDIGMTSLRFDLSGLGDSQSIGTESGSRAQAVCDVKAAMDFMQEVRGTQRFLVFGVCSGAVVCYDIAQLDDRIVGITMFDGFWYRSRWTRIVFYLKKVSLMTLPKLRSAVARRLAPKRADPTNEVEPPSLWADNPPIASYIEVMQKLVDRGTDVRVIYGGSLVDRYNYVAQFEHVFGRYPFYKKTRCNYEPEVDHTFVTRQAQQRMLEILTDWGRSHLAESAAH